jgi:hypothetical protein
VRRDRFVSGTNIFFPWYDALDEFQDRSIDHGK